MLVSSALFNSLSNAYMHQHRTPTLPQIMACCLLSAKPLSKSMLPYCQLPPKEHISVKFYFKLKSSHSQELTLKCCLQNDTILYWPQCVKRKSLQLNITMMSYEHHGISSQLDCLYNSFFWLTTKKMSKPTTMRTLHQ